MMAAQLQQSTIDQSAPGRTTKFNWRVAVALAALPALAVVVGLISGQFMVTPEVMANKGKPIVPPTASSTASSTAAVVADETGEAAKIEKLLEAVAKADAKFIRNGQEHSPADAANHLRRKYDSAKKNIKTAKQFIDEVASKSKVSGDPYQIKLPDGKQVPLRDWLTERLTEIESAKK